MNKVALFDFCETLVNFQTADAYVDFVREKIQDKRMLRIERIQNYLTRIKIVQFIEIITRYRYSINKRIKLLQLRGLQLETLQTLAKDYYLDKIKPNFIPDLLDRLIKLRNEGYIVLLVSGGYDIYLRFFVDEYSLTGLISTRIGFKGNVCTGKFDGIDCLRDGKTILLNNYYSDKPTYSIAFSDSITDLPFLKWVDEGYVVSRNKSQKWAKDNQLNEIIWTERYY